MISAGLIIIYAAAALFLMMVFRNMRVYDDIKKEAASPVSIVISARNEEKCIKECLQSVFRQNYAKHLIEIILVNDAGIDKTVEIASFLLANSGVDYTIINNEKQIGKKKSIRKAVSAAKHEWIVTRDADTFTKSDQWLSVLMSYAINEKKQFVIAPVMASGNDKLISLIQKAEGCVLEVLTAVTAKIKKPFLCSGANLAFTRSIFNQTGAYASHIEIPSGDDVLFLEDVKRINPETVGYVHHISALVNTYTVTGTEELLNQRVRWASKVFVNSNLINIGIAAFVVIINAFFIFHLLNLLMYGCVISLFFIAIKLLIDNLLVFLAAGFFNEQFSLVRYLAVGICYPFYALMVATGSFLKNPKWK